MVDYTRITTFYEITNGSYESTKSLGLRTKRVSERVEWFRTFVSSQSVLNGLGDVTWFYVC